MMSMTVEDLINRLMESGDEKFRKLARVEIGDTRGLSFDLNSATNVRVGLNKVVIEAMLDSVDYGSEIWSGTDDDEW